MVSEAALITRAYVLFLTAINDLYRWQKLTISHMWVQTMTLTVPQHQQLLIAGNVWPQDNANVHLEHTPSGTSIRYMQYDVSYNRPISTVLLGTVLEHWTEKLAQ